MNYHKVNTHVNTIQGKEQNIASFSEASRDPCLFVITEVVTGLIQDSYVVTFLIRPFLPSGSHYSDFMILRLCCCIRNHSAVQCSDYGYTTVFFIYFFNSIFYSTFDGHLCYFLILAIKNNVSMNTCTHLLLNMCTYFSKVCIQG